MLGLPNNSALRGWYRGVALILLSLLALTPSCSVICQARACPISQSADSDESCHHQQLVSSEDSLRFTAAFTPCESHELPALLPIDKGSFGANVTSASPVTVSAFFAVLASYDRIPSGHSNPSDTGPGNTGPGHNAPRFSVRQFSFDTFVFLRV
jgi:hypothetical protein